MELKEIFVKYQEFLPQYDDVIEVILKELSKYYKEFIDEGKFYTHKYHREYGRDYYEIIEDNGVGKPYESIGDWLDELTGTMGSHFMPKRFRDMLEEFIDDTVYPEVDFDDESIYEKYPDIEDELGGLTLNWEVVDVISAISIDELENRIKQLN